MLPYTRSEARAWARETLKGCINCTIPSFTADLEGINEKGVRHDVALAREHGFIGSLGVSEVSITLPEYIGTLKMMKAEGGKDFIVTHHASWNTLKQNIEAAQAAEAAGASFLLMSYPPNFYPEDEDAIFEYTKAVCDATGLAVLLFPMYLWGFAPRVHPADISADLCGRLIDACPNVVAIKAEGGYPTIQHAIECQRRFGDEVLISVPIEHDVIPLAQVMPTQLWATSDYEFWGPLIPQIHKMIMEGRLQEATDWYWKMHPVRKIKGQIGMAMNGGFFINRMLWKYQGWLQGYNGGPLRLPTQRMHDAQMNALRNALKAAGFAAETAPNSEFFIGRNPA